MGLTTRFRTFLDQRDPDEAPPAGLRGSIQERLRAAFREDEWDEPDIAPPTVDVATRLEGWQGPAPTLQPGATPFETEQ